jgi:hypothetical protein
MKYLTTLFCLGALALASACTRQEAGQTEGAASQGTTTEDQGYQSPDTGTGTTGDMTTTPPPEGDTTLGTEPAMPGDTTGTTTPPDTTSGTTGGTSDDTSSQSGQTSSDTTGTGR